MIDVAFTDRRAEIPLQPGLFDAMRRGVHRLVGREDQNKSASPLTESRRRKYYYTCVQVISMAPRAAVGSFHAARYANPGTGKHRHHDAHLVRLPLRIQRLRNGSHEFLWAEILMRHPTICILILLFPVDGDLVAHGPCIT